MHLNRFTSLNQMDNLLLGTVMWLLIVSKGQNLVNLPSQFSFVILFSFWQFCEHFLSSCQN